MRDFEIRRLGLKIKAELIRPDPATHWHGLMKVIVHMGEPQTYIPWSAIEEWFSDDAVRQIRDRGGLTSQEMDERFPRWRDFAARELERTPLYNPCTARS